jgi:hypothetical protein
MPSSIDSDAQYESVQADENHKTPNSNDQELVLPHYLDKA